MNIAAQMMLAPAWRCSGRNNDEMVDRFVDAGLISSKDVEDAFRAIPRGAFVPSDQFDEAYFDSPLRGDPHVHMSAPHMYATVLEALDLCPGLSFLNIGSGTGYFSCLVGYLIKRNSINHGIEHYEDLAEYCQERCDDFMRYSPSVANEMSQPVFLTGNCFRLDHRDRQYDRIYCGAACPPNKVPFVLSMTKVGGFAIIPCKNKLLRIDRVSPTGVKQSVIREVSFSPLAALPSSEENQPKLKFPPVGDKKKQKTLKVYPPSDLLVSNGMPRKILARLRALQEASECLRSSECLPLPFCYIPDQQQIKELKTSKKIKETANPNETQTAAAVDSKITFFSSCSGQGQCTETSDKWDFINNDKLWEKVIEHYYSVCTTSNEENLKALQLYVKRKTKKHAQQQNPSYAELMSRLGLPVDSSGNDKELSEKSVDNCRERDGNCTENTQPSTVEAVDNNCKSKEQQSTVLENKNEDCKKENEMCSQISRTSVSQSSPSSKDGTQEMGSGISKLTKHAKGDQTTSSKECHTRRKAFKENKSSHSSESDRKKSEYSNVLIEVDNHSMKKLNSSPKKSWCLEDDKELVRFLSEISHQSSKGRCKGWFKPELVRPSLFSRIDSLAYPRLTNMSADDLAYRTVGLCRVANILDSSLHLLTGSSLLNEYTTTKNKYPMDSFNDSSFETSRNSSNVSFEHLPVEIKRKPKEESYDYGMMNADQLRVQLELTSKKLKLTQELQEQIKEQQKVLRKQASLLEEKQLLIQNLSLLDIHRHSERPQTSEQQLVVELKTQRQDVLSRIQKLSDQYALQETKKAELVEELKQVKEERNRIVEFESRKKEVPDPPQESVEHHQTEETKTSQTEQVQSKTSSSRFQIAHLLPHLRFLLPLCRQRWRLVQEMLHASECSAPDHLPIVTVDRRVPLCERGGRTECSVLLQVFKELRPEGLNYRWNKWKYDQWWEVKFVGEGIIDQGGGFRDSLVEIADEICPPEKSCGEVLPFFIKTPNNKDGVGDYQDVYIPTPLSKQWYIFEWIGKLFGAAYRTDENLTVSCPPFFWKLLVGEHVTWARDYADIDESVVRFTDALEASDEYLYDAAYGVDCNFTTVLSDGSRVDLIPGGRDIPVKSDERQKFAALLRQARMTESVKQVLAIRKGLISVVPESVLRLLTWAELERGVCGNPDVSVSVLKSACKYGDDLSESTECIKHLWSALSKFTNDERSKFLRFVTGRRRPPSPFTVVKAGGTNELPNASTCASSLFWPNYPSAAVATARLRYAIYNCIAIDTDTSPW